MPALLEMMVRSLTPDARIASISAEDSSWLTVSVLRSTASSASPTPL